MQVIILMRTVALTCNSANQFWHFGDGEKKIKNGARDRKKNYKRDGKHRERERERERETERERERWLLTWYPSWLEPFAESWLCLQIKSGGEWPW